VFECLLALDRDANVIEAFLIDELMKTVTRGEPLLILFAMFVDAARQIIRDADIERSVTFVAHDVDEANP
jgi:hypothetical protein